MKCSIYATLRVKGSREKFKNVYILYTLFYVYESLKTYLRKFYIARLESLKYNLNCTKFVDKVESTY